MRVEVQKVAVLSSSRDTEDILEGRFVVLPRRKGFNLPNLA